MTISPERIEEDLKVAVDHAWAFLGLERLDGVVQYVANADECLETQDFTIGGQEVNMQSNEISQLIQRLLGRCRWIARSARATRRMCSCKKGSLGCRYRERRTCG